MRPNRLLAQTYVFRGARLWLVTRAAVAGVFLLAGSDPVQLPTVVTVPLLFLTVFICILDTKRHRETDLLGNLGVGPILLATMYAVPALIGEVTLRLVAAML